MHRSPLQLNWITYPAATFETLFNEHAATSAQSATISARVTYRVNGDHCVELTITNAESDTAVAAYSFRIDALAGFSFDPAVAASTYNVERRDELPISIAVNMARILYASAREYLSLITARAPHGSLLIESLLIEPKDVKIGSVESQEEVMHALFGTANDEGKPKKPSSRKKASA